jgi:hypothetical protein
MKIEGIYFSEYYWPRYNTLWAYRFYPDGALLSVESDLTEKMNGLFTLQRA